MLKLDFWESPNYPKINQKFKEKTFAEIFQGWLCAFAA